MEFLVKKATLDDWADIKQLFSVIHNSNASKYISTTEEQAEGYLLNSLMYPDSVGLLLLKNCIIDSFGYSEVLIGVSTLLATPNPQMGIRGLSPVRHAFNHMVYISPYIYKYVDPTIPETLVTPATAGELLKEEMEKWSRERSCEYIYGNIVVKPNRIKAYERKYGVQAVHTTIAKKL